MRFNQVYDDLEEFVDAYRGTISREGMLLDADTPYPEGTVLSIEITLGDTFPMIHGTAGVVSLLSGDPNTKKACSMVLEFLQLDPESEGFVNRLVDRYESEGVDPFPFYTYLGPGRRGIRREPPSDPLDTSGVSSRFGPGATTEADSISSKAADSAPGPIERNQHRRTVGRWAFAAAVWCIGCLGVTAASIMLITNLQLMPLVSPGALVADSKIFGLSPGSDRGDTSESTSQADPTPTAPNHDSPATQEELLPPATTIKRVDWVDYENSTIVTVEADGLIDRDAVGHFLMTDDPRPRLILYLDGLGSNDLAYRSTVAGDRLGAVRVWYHDDKSPVQLHIVLDFANPDVVFQPPEIDGNLLSVILSDRSPSAAGP